MATIKARIEALERAAAARKPGLKLTYLEGEPVILEASDVEAIAAAKAQGKIVYIADDPLPPGGVIM